MGFDGTPSYGFEAVDRPGTRAGTATVRATLWSLGILIGFSALAAWAMQVHYGVHEIAAAAGDPNVGVPFDVLVERYGLMIEPFTWIVLALGVLCTQLSLLAVVARYFYAMANDGVLPSAVAFSGRGIRVGNPIGGARLQSAISLVVIVGSALLHADPMAVMFPSLATLGALGLVASLILASVAALAGLRDSDESVLVRLIAPVLGVLGGGWLFGELVTHISALLQTGPGSLTPIVIPAILGAVTVGGLCWAWYLRGSRPAIYERIGQDTTKPLQHAAVQLTGVTL